MQTNKIIFAHLPKVCYSAPHLADLDPLERTDEMNTKKSTDEVRFGAFRDEGVQPCEKKPNQSLDKDMRHRYILTPVVIKLPTLKCTRCGYEWHPRSENPPKVCPNKKCKSPYWDRKRTLGKGAA